MIGKNKKINLLIVTALAIIFALIASLVYNKINALQLNNFLFTKTILLFFPIEFLFLHFIFDKKELYNIIFEKRYIIAFCILFALVFLELSGSSIGMWSQCFGSLSGKDINVFGKPREIRYDEWAVNTPMAISQYFNLEEKFPYFSNVVRGSRTDMFIVYGQPVWDIAVLFRPFHWGYLLLGIEKGLSFFWYGRLIALFLVSFEFGRLITKDNRPLSVALAMLISFAPIVQWWFAVNGIAEILIFSQLILLLINAYMKTESYKKRIIYAILFVISSGCFILVFYPAWQIPVIYIMLGFFIWLLLENWKGFKKGKKDIFILIGVIVILALGFAHILYKSMDTIKLVMGTVYPGKRFETGGGSIKEYIKYTISLILPFKEINGFLDTNLCKEAVFYDLFPCGYIIAFWVILKEKNKDILLKILLAIALLLNLWCIVPFNAVLAKISMLYVVPPYRCIFAVGLLNIYILGRALALQKGFLSRKINIVIALAISIIMMLISKKIYGDYLTSKIIVVIAITLIISIYLLFNYTKSFERKAFVVYMCLIAFISGGFVNPIAKGIGNITENELFKAIREIDQKEKGNWIFDSIGYPTSNFSMMAGVSSPGSTSVYPDFDKWHKLDKDKKYEDIYNRYANIEFEITNNESSSFALKRVDIMKVYITLSDLYKLNINYVISTNDLDIYNSDMFKKIYENDNFKIYKIDYSNVNENSFEMPNFEELQMQNDVNLNYCIDTVSPSEEYDISYIKGWAFADNTNPDNQDIILKIENENGNIKYIKTLREARKDVAQVYGNDLYNNCGFKAVIENDLLESGKNYISVISYNGNKGYISSDKYEYVKQ